MAWWNDCSFDGQLEVYTRCGLHNASCAQCGARVHCDPQVGYEGSALLSAPGENDHETAKSLSDLVSFKVINAYGACNSHP